MRRCRCRRAAGCRPRLLAIPPFQSARAGAPVQAPKTASLLVSRQWPWTYVVATSSTSWKRWRGRPPANSWALGDRRQDVRLQRMQHDVCRGDLRSGGASLTEGRDKTARRAHGPQPEKSMRVEFVSGVYPGRRHRHVRQYAFSSLIVAPYRACASGSFPRPASRSACVDSVRRCAVRASPWVE